MSRCAGLKPDGSACERIVRSSQMYCFAHDPSKEEARKRNAAKAGASKPNRELANVKTQLQEISDRVLRGELDARKATAAVQALNTLLRGIEIERRVRELEEIEHQLAELEARASQQRGWVS
jgi:hypothetical protein